MEALSAGTPAPRFALQDTDDRIYSLPEALQQGPVLLAFFKESCPVCQFTFKFLERIHQGVKHRDDVQVWGISQDNAADTRAFARDAGCTFPLLLDEEGYPISNQYGLTNVPTLFLVSADSTIQVSSVGFSREDIEGVADNFSRLTGEPIAVFQPGDNVPDFKAG